MPNIRILDQAVLKISFGQGFFPCYNGKVEKGHNLVNIPRNSLKTLNSSHIPNIRILAQAVLKISC